MFMKKNYQALFAFGIVSVFVSLSFQNCSPATMSSNLSSTVGSASSGSNIIKASAPATYFGAQQLATPKSLSSPTATPAIIDPAARTDLSKSPETTAVKTPGAVNAQTPVVSSTVQATPEKKCQGCIRSLAPKLISAEYNKTTKNFTIVAEDILDYDILWIKAFESQMVLQVYDLSSKPSLHTIAANLISQNGSRKTYEVRGTDFLIKNAAGGFRIQIEGGRVDSSLSSNEIILTETAKDSSALPMIKCNKDVVNCGETFSCYAIGANLIGTMWKVKPENISQYNPNEKNELVAKSELVAAGWKKVNPAYYTYQSGPINENVDVVYQLEVANEVTNYASFANISVKKCDQEAKAVSCSVSVVGDSQIQFKKSVMFAGQLNYLGNREGMKVKWIGTNKNALNNYVVTGITEDVTNWEGSTYAFEDERYAGEYSRALQFYDKSGAIICTTDYVFVNFWK